MKRSSPYVLAFWLSSLFTGFFLTGCESRTNEAATGAGDLAGFELSNIPGSQIKYAVRKDPAGQKVIEGYVLDDKRTGQWIQYSAEGDIETMENYVNGLPEGPSFKFAARGQVDSKANFHQGQLHGEWVQYKYGKVLEERNYNMGKLDGVVKTYEDRTWKLRQEVHYKDGKQDGLFRYYDENGNVTLEYEYKNGEKVSGGIVEKK